jgi:hypothetical protein
MSWFSATHVNPTCYAILLNTPIVILNVTVHEPIDPACEVGLLRRLVDLPLALAHLPFKSVSTALSSVSMGPCA